MSKTYTVTLSDAEDKAFAYAAVDPQFWVENVVKERCRVAMEEIVANEVQRKLALGETISGSKDDIVLSAPIKTAAEAQAEFITANTIGETK